MRQVSMIACLAACAMMTACRKSDASKPAALPGIEAPADWGPVVQDYIENREGGEGATVKTVLDAQIERYREWTPTVEIEAKTDTSVTLVLDLSDLRRGKEAAAGVTPDPSLLAAPADRIRMLLEVRPNGPVFVVRTREFDINDTPPATGG
ncbi:MAG: hypothetical protein ACK5ZG_16185 [Phycisphaerae bacterium]